MMRKKEITKEYENEDILVKWQPHKCVHAGVCVKSLPNVYKPKEKPWITIENGTTDELKAQISNCPSRALTYEEKDK